MSTATSPNHPHTRASRTALFLIVGGALLAALAFLCACTDGRQWLAVTNTSPEMAVEVRVGGDRLLILAPLTTEYIPLSPAAWAWPRRIEVYRFPDGPRVLAWRADLTDLAENHWQLRVP